MTSEQFRRESGLPVTAAAPTDHVRIMRGEKSTAVPIASLPASPAVQEQIDTLAAGQAAGRITARTWSELSARTGASGVGADVIDDTGSHTDPVTGATVPNAGGYVWSASPAGWRWVRPDVLPLKADQTAVDAVNAVLADKTTQNARVVEFPNRGLFVANELHGAYGTDLVTPAVTNWVVNASGELELLDLPSTSQARHYWMGHSRPTDRVISVVARAVFTDMSGGASGFVVGFGSDSTAYRGLIYKTTGELALVDNTMVTVGSVALADTTAAIAEDVEATLEVTVFPDGSGYAIGRNGTTYNRLEFTGVPLGRVWLGWRRSSPGMVTGWRVDLREPEDARRVAHVTAKAVSGFIPSDLSGMFAAANGALSSAKVKVDGDGDAVVTSSLSGFTLARTPYSRALGQAAEYTAEMKIDTAGSQAGGAIITIGDDPDTRVASAYLTNGLVGTLTKSNAVGQGSAVAGMSYSSGSRVRLRLSVYEDNTGLIEAFSPSGQRATFALASVPAGRVCLGWRGDNVGRYYLLRQRDIAGAMASRVRALEEAVPAFVLYPTASRVLPDYPPGRASPGFTCTGLDLLAGTGWYRGCWVVGDDGRIGTGDGTPFAPAIHVLDHGCTRILVTIPGGYTGASLQGVAADRLATTQTVWAACSANGTIRNYNLYGVNAGQEIVADRIVMSDLGLAGFEPNALAFDATRGTGRGALWVGGSSGTTAYCIDCDPTAGTRIIDTITLQSNPDQFQVYNGKLLYIWGGSSTRPNVRQFDPVTDADTLLWGPLEWSFASEGIYYDDRSGLLYMVHDGGFHNDLSGPSLNLMQTFRVSRPR